MSADQLLNARDFLLGNLSEKDKEATENKFFEDTASFDELLIAENELYDSYVANQLSAEDRERFESRLLITPKQRERAAFARVLTEYARQVSAQGKEPVQTSWRRALMHLFTFNPMLSYGFSLAAVLLLAILGIWWISFTPAPSTTEVAVMTPREVSNTETDPVPVAPSTAGQVPAPADNDEPGGDRTTNSEQRAAVGPTRTETPAKSPLSVVSTIILTAGSVRSDGEAKVYSLPNDSTRVDLKLEYGEFDHDSYYVLVETADGQQIWGGKAQRKGDVVTLGIPARRIRTGDYIVSLKGLSPAKTYDTVADYSFSIERK